jgi:hypothetical protein
MLIPRIIALVFFWWLALDPASDEGNGIDPHG